MISRPSQLVFVDRPTLQRVEREMRRVAREHRLTALGLIDRTGLLLAAVGDLPLPPDQMGATAAGVFSAVSAIVHPAEGFEFTVYLYTLPGLPEIIEIGQALALDWQAVGLKPKLVEIDFPRVREQYRTKSIHGAVWPLRGSPNALNVLRIFNKAQGSVVYAYEHPFIEERLEALGKVVDPSERTRLLREAADHKFNEFAAIPMFWERA